MNFRYKYYYDQWNISRAQYRYAIQKHKGKYIEVDLSCPCCAQNWKVERKLFTRGGTPFINFGGEVVEVVPKPQGPGKKAEWTTLEIWKQYHEERAQRTAA